MGHVRNYSLGDVVARFKRARGYSVLHPMGWDAFGLPAENAAAERGVDPKAWTYENIARMRSELKELGLSIDWSREFATCDIEYYGKQQALFLDLFASAAWSYRKQAWSTGTRSTGAVLANEQVDRTAAAWRSNAAVEKRKLNQWFMRITRLYRRSLIAGLDTLSTAGRTKGLADAGQLDPAGPRGLKMIPFPLDGSPPPLRA